MNSTTEDIKDFIELSDTGLGWTFGTNMFIGFTPETPDNCICIYDTGGYPPQSNYDYFKPTIQIMIRGNKQDYQSAWDDAKQLMTALHGVHGEVINLTTYIQILSMSDILFLGYDKNKRPEFSINFEIHRS